MTILLTFWLIVLALLCIAVIPWDAAIAKAKPKPKPAMPGKPKPC
jgi:hypothetical protein